MAWLRIDDRVRTHPKIANAGPAAAWLWFCGVCYCREHLTDGFIPKAVVGSLAMNLSSPFRHAARLVEVRLWEDAEGGYQVHDFLDWNPSRADVQNARTSEADRKRTERHVSGRTNSGHPPDVSARTPDDVREMSSCVRAGDAGSGSPSGSVLPDLDLGEKHKPDRPTGALQPVFRQHARAPSLVGNHVGCFFAPAACARGICVPGWLGQQWLQQYGDDRGTAEAEIAQVVAAALSVLPPTGPIGDPPKQFWMAVWSAAHGSSAPAAGQSRGKGQLTLDAAKRVVQDRLRRSGQAS